MAGDIRALLEDLGFGKYAEAFVANDVDLRALPHLTDEDLKDIGVSLGHRRVILAAASKLVDESATEFSARGPAASIKAERRQLTVMFCDLVGSTVLSRQLDPEDLRDVMRRYQDAVAGSITRYGGHVAKYLGDGVLAYFGWPQAYEDQAERAVRAALDAVSAVNDVQASGNRALEARVGIASGRVVVGDLVGESGRDAEAVSGETPNLAARLQDVAASGQVVIEKTTRQLVGTAFTLNSLGPRDLKGFPAAVDVWSVIGEGTAESRFEAAQLEAPTPLVGRGHELGLLNERWALAKSGEGQVVVLSGEAGIGKSRMVQALRDQVAKERHFRLRYQCTPHHTNSAFYPVIRRLERAARFATDDGVESKLDKLEQLLRMSEQGIDSIAPLFANLLSVPGEDRYGRLDLDPQQLRAQTISALIDQVLALSNLRPVLYVMEDAHWIDPTTEALVRETIARLQGAAVLLVITHRPEYTAPFLDHPHLTSVTLNRLSRLQGAELARELAGEGLADAAIDHIGERADGVPLFVEELTKSVLEVGAAIDGPSANLIIPATLQASLVARLDHLGTAKDIAQIGAVIGREFSHQLIAAMAAHDGPTLIEELQVLVDSGLVFRRGGAPVITYSFKHALIRDVAYDELLRNRRRELHERIARTLEKEFPALVEAEPELVAHHLSEAGQFSDAIEYWHRAGRQSLQRSAYLEANAHLTKGIELLDELEESPHRDRVELGLILDIGAIQTATKGFGAPEVSKAYERARTLCERFEVGPDYFTTLWGLWVINQIKAEYETAQNLSHELLDLAPKLEKSEYLLQADHAAWTTQFTCGDFLATAKHTENGRRVYDQHTHASHAFYYGGHDPGVCCNIFSAMTSWILGYPNKALHAAHVAIDLAQEVHHPFSSCQAGIFGAYVHQFRGDEEDVELLGREVMSTASDNGFPFWIGFASVMTGWARIRQGTHGDEFGNMRQNLEQERSAGSGFMLPYRLSLLAEVCGLLNEPEEGLSVTVEALDMARASGERWWQAELHRLEGEFRLRVDNDATLAESCFAASMEIAQLQSAKSLELRAATSLAQLMQGQGRKRESQNLLAPIYDWFTEGFDTPDLIEAKALLDELL